MNRGGLQNNSPVVQQMMAAGNPSLWNINNLMKPPFISSSSSSSSSPPSSSSSNITNFLAPPPNNNNNHHHHSNNNHNHNHSINTNNIFQGHNNMNISTTTSASSSWLDDADHQQQHPTNHVHQEHPLPFPESWSQLLLGGGFLGEEQVLLQQHHHQSIVDHVKQESSVNSYSNTSNNNVYTTHHDQEFQQAAAKAANLNWSHINNNIIIPASSPQSCVTTTFSSNNNNNNNNNLLDFSSNCTSDNLHPRHSNPLPVPGDHSSESNSISTGGGALKKAKVQPSSSPTTFKVRKEKLGDRITALHQLVSPFGKTDTASVLLEAIGYIRFLQSQIEALSLPYLTSGAGPNRQPHNVQGERKCILPEDPGQESIEEAKKDLKSRGLCLVPLSCTMHVGSDNGADYWAPTTLGGGFR